MRLRNRVTAFALLSMALPSLVIPTYAQQKPNVVFMLADNVGYGDLGPYGGGELRGAPTPRIDQLANEGLRLTQYLVEPGCTPSRGPDDGAVFDPQRAVADPRCR
jgi:arylsulfatase